MVLHGGDVLARSMHSGWKGTVLIGGVSVIDCFSLFMQQSQDLNEMAGIVLA